MALSTDTINSLPDYTSAQMLKMVNHAIMSLLGGGQSVTIDQNTYTKADLDKLRAFRSELMAEGAIDENDTGMIALARFGNPQ